MAALLVLVLVLHMHVALAQGAPGGTPKPLVRLWVTVDEEGAAVKGYVELDLPVPRNTSGFLDGFLRISLGRGSLTTVHSMAGELTLPVNRSLKGFSLSLELHGVVNGSGREAVARAGLDAAAASPSLGTLRYVAPIEARMLRSPSAVSINISVSDGRVFHNGEEGRFTLVYSYTICTATHLWRSSLFFRAESKSAELLNDAVAPILRMFLVGKERVLPQYDKSRGLFYIEISRGSRGLVPEPEIASIVRGPQAADIISGVEGWVDATLRVVGGENSTSVSIRSRGELGLLGNFTGGIPLGLGDARITRISAIVTAVLSRGVIRVLGNASAYLRGLSPFIVQGALSELLPRLMLLVDLDSRVFIEARRGVEMMLGNSSLSRVVLTPFNASKATFLRLTSGGALLLSRLTSALLRYVEHRGAHTIRVLVLNTTRRVVVKVSSARHVEFVFLNTEPGGKSLAVTGSGTYLEIVFGRGAQPPRERVLVELLEEAPGTLPTNATLLSRVYRIDPGGPVRSAVLRIGFNTSAVPPGYSPAIVVWVNSSPRLYTPLSLDPLRGVAEARLTGPLSIAVAAVRRGGGATATEATAPRTTESATPPPATTIVKTVTQTVTATHTVTLLTTVKRVSTKPVFVTVRVPFTVTVVSGRGGFDVATGVLVAVVAVMAVLLVLFMRRIYS